ncbi:MAG: MBL fold metallo-hydrolase [Solidesulfovibrio sp. DCME]|uniref:MBL fold metallo-hydrolase n=1 Tax=Solidesulfovibrio sp. DCME TaxID=3447380 RepID=UPI003D0C68E3
MNLRVLGCSGSDLPGHNLTSFLVNDTVLLDAGTVTSAIDLAAQARIEHIFVSHAHLDHIKDILFLADNLIEFFAAKSRPPLAIHGLPDVLDAIANHLLNDTIWPDFTVIPQNSPILTYAPMVPGEPVVLGELTVAAFAVNHAKAASGFVLWEDGGDRNLAYTGDTGPCDDCWRFLDGLPFPLAHLITEASFPSSLEALAMASRHLTPKLLRRELEKLQTRPEILIYHMKAPFAAQIQDELEHELAGFTYRLLREHDRITI